MKRYFLILFFLFSLIIPGKELNAEPSGNNGYFWEKLTPNEKLTYVLGYTEGIGELNAEIRHQMSILVLLYDKEKTQKYKYLAEYGKEMSDYYEENYHYFNIPYRQFVEGIDAIYKEYKNKTITLVDAFELVKAEIKGLDKNELERRMSFMRLTKEEQDRIIQKDTQEKKN